MNMKKHLIKGFLYHVQYAWEKDEEASIKFSASSTMADGEAWALIGPYEFYVEVPVDFDPRPSKLTSLREQKRNIQAEFTAKVTEINQRISQLLAIEN
jgi:hypothetical protein